MENQIITGVGCFAGPEKLSRIFMRMVQTYTLGKLDGIEWIYGRESDETEGTRLLKALITGKAARLDAALPDAVDRYENKKITGFFLTLRDQGLELSIFAENGDSRRERHSAVLSEFTQMRQRRLN
jgi:hypothetical protein